VGWRKGGFLRKEREMPLEVGAVRKKGGYKSIMKN